MNCGRGFFFFVKPNLINDVNCWLHREKRAVEAIMTMLDSPVRVWHCCAAELLGRLVVNPDNEPFLLPFAPQVPNLFYHSTLNVKDV